MVGLHDRRTALFDLAPEVADILDIDSILLCSCDFSLSIHIYAILYPLYLIPYPVYAIPYPVYAIPYPISTIYYPICLIPYFVGTSKELSISIYP